MNVDSDKIIAFNIVNTSESGLASDFKRVTSIVKDNAISNSCLYLFITFNKWASTR